MDIQNIVSTDYPQVDTDTKVSKLATIFEDSAAPAIVVLDDGEYEGVVTRRQLTASHNKPEAKARKFLWNVPKISRTENVREVARLMVGSESMLLPVMENEEVVGVVTANDLLAEVRPYLDVLTVEDVASTDLVTVDADSTVGEALHEFRENSITHLPVMDEGSLVGILSLVDVVDFITRDIDVERGGTSGRESTGRGHGGYGPREGELERMLDLPVSNMMSEPVDTVSPDEAVDDAVDRMLDLGVSSLVVTENSDTPWGIVTKRDVLESLTWSGRGHRAVQVYGVDLLDDMTYEDVAELIDEVSRKYSAMTVLEAKVHLHEHEERLRGTPLILARIRLFTDKGMFIASEEGYGAKHALNLARNAVERQILEGKTHGQTKKHPDEETLRKLYGWWLSG
ncbi:CBS domain-containing protein [Salinirarus marinus]|uniref:CBS domain-containing protein n=1 Tax=Salinirarus marinus TaxID=3068310 RepID=UPI003C6BE671